MHFSIPDTQELKDPKSGVFTAFNIHVNGVFHCTVRYKQLFNLNEQLRKAFGADAVPPFPPKKVFSLSQAELDERRSMLEKYVQLVSQDYKMMNSALFTNFFLNAQQETQQQEPEEVTIDVYLVNGHKITVRTLSTEQTDGVLEATCMAIELPPQYTYYFGLYLVVKDKDGESCVIRKLQDFESPVISLRAATKDGAPLHKLVLRKSYWDSALDDDLIDDRIAMNLLHVQALNDVERGLTIGTKDQLAQLAALQKRGSKKEYLKLARTLTYYGYTHFKPCTTNYPEPGTKVTVAAGNKELSFRAQVAPNEVKEGVFKITRVRCWRILAASASVRTTMELSLEYLVAKDTLKWITLQTDQAILLSMCMQGMVDELMMKKEGRKMRRPQDRARNGPASTYLKRDGTLAAPAPGGSGDGSSSASDNASVASAASSTPIKKLVDKVSGLSIMGRPMKPSSTTVSLGDDQDDVTDSGGGGSSRIGNAYHGIGDDDL